MAKSQAATQKAQVGSVYQLLPVVGPTEGVDLRTSPTLLRPGQARTLVNFSLTEPGALVVRAGWKQFSTGSLGSTAIRGGARVYLNTALPSPNSTTFTLVGWSSGVYVATDSGGWLSTTPAKGGFSTTTQWDFPSDRDLVAVFDGASTQPWKSTNGSSWTLLGIQPSTKGPTLSSAAFSNGVSTSEFEVGFTYKDRDLAFESNGSSQFSTISIASSANSAINVVIPNSTDPQVDAIVVYARNKTSGETVLRKVSSLVQSGGANSTYVIQSSAWTTNDEIPTDHNPPTTLAFGVVWKSRWWARDGTVTNRLRFTQLFLPEAWPPLFYVDIPFEKGDAIQALQPLGDTLLVFGTTKIFIIFGQTSLDFDVRPTLSSEDGALGFRAVARIENGVIHAGGTGVYIFDGASDKLLSWAIDPAWRDLLQNTSPANLAKVAVTYHQLLKELRIAVPRRYPSATYGEWILDLNRTLTSGEPSWTATDRTIGGYIPWSGPEPNTGDRGRLFSWDATTGVLNEEGTGTSANSSNLTASYEGPGLTLGVYRARWVDLRGEYEPHSGAFSLQPVVDGVTLQTQSVNIGASGPTWGQTFYWGVSKWGGTATRKQFQMNLPLESDGRTFVLKATYSGQEKFRWYSYHPGLVPETRSRDFSE